MENKLFNSSKVSNLEVRFREQGYSLIAGIDEAGRGALAGPVFAAAVILPPEFESLEIKDSKLLSPQKREKLFDYICEIATDYAISYVEVEEINKIGISKATFKAMFYALKKFYTFLCHS